MCRLHLATYCKRYTVLCLRHQSFLTKLNHVRQRQKVSLLVLLNVKSLHTNIRNNEGIKAVPEAYDKHPSKALSAKVIITFLSLILTLNNFILTFSHYL